MTNKYIEIEMQPAMKFEHGISDFKIGGVKILADKMCLNYDRKGNIFVKWRDILEFHHTKLLFPATAAELLSYIVFFLYAFVHYILF